MTTLSDVLDTTALEEMASGFVFTEGPLWHPEGFYYFVDVRTSTLYRLIPGQGTEKIPPDPGRQRHNLRSARAPDQLRRRRQAAGQDRNQRRSNDIDRPVRGQAAQPAQRRDLLL